MLNRIESLICFLPPNLVFGAMLVLIALLVLTAYLVGFRLMACPPFTFSEAQKDRAMDRLRDQAYNSPALFRVSQSPALPWLMVGLLSILTAWGATIYPSGSARFCALRFEARQIRDQDAAVRTKGLQKIQAEARPWTPAANFEVRWHQPIWFSPFPASWLWMKGQQFDPDAEAATLVNTARTVAALGLGIGLLGLVVAALKTRRSPLGESHHGRSAWASRSEVSCVVNKKDRGYFVIPMQVSQSGDREWEQTYTAPCTVLAPSAKSNCSHGLIIGPTGAGKGAYGLGHFFATSTVPIVYQDAKGETPAWRLRPNMIRFGIPANRPKGLPTMRFNPIAEIHRPGLTENQRITVASQLASLLLPTPAEKTANSWINDTAQPLLVEALIGKRWEHLGELADEIEGHPLPFILADIAIGAGRAFSLGGKNVLQYAANELANNTAPYLRGWARHAFSASDFTIEEIWTRGAYIMAATESPREKIPIQLLWSLIWNDAQKSATPLPALVLIDEAIAAGKIPGIVEATVKLRDRGVSIWMAFQTYAGITSVYGRDDADTLRRSLVNTLVLTNGLDPQDAAEISRELGTYTLTEVDKKTRHVSRTKLELFPASTLGELAGQEDEFWGIWRGRGMSKAGRPVIGKLVPIQRGMWNCIATEEEYSAEEQKYGHGQPVKSRYSYTLKLVYRQAAQAIIRLTDGKPTEALAAFADLEKAIAEKGLMPGIDKFIQAFLKKDQQDNHTDDPAESEGNSEPGEEATETEDNYQFRL